MTGPTINKRAGRGYKSGYMRKRNAYGYLFTLPWALGFLCFFISPFVQTILYSFFKVDLFDQRINMEFSGLAFFRDFIGESRVDVSFLPNLFESVSDVIINLPIIIIFSLFAATLIHKKFPGVTVVHVIFFLSIIFGSGLFINMQQDNSVGLGSGFYTIQVSDFTDLVWQVGGIFPFFDTMLGLVDRLYNVITLSGVQILIFLAGLKSIPESYYEASKIDGARAWNDFWLITLPVITPFILMNTVYTIIDSFTSGNNPMMTVILDNLKAMRYSQGAARALVYFITIFVIVIIISGLISSKVVYTGGEFD